VVVPSIVNTGSRLLSVVWGLLSTDPTLSASPLSGRIYKSIAPSTAVYPFVLIEGISNVDLNTLAGVHVKQTAAFQITVRGKGGTSTDSLEPIAEQVASVLVQVDRLVSNGIYVARIWRTREVPRPPDNVNNILYPQLLAEYESEVCPER
jgi:hypothetical protein